MPPKSPKKAPNAVPANAPRSGVSLSWLFVAAAAAGIAYVASQLSATSLIPAPAALKRIRPGGLMCSRTNGPTFVEDIKYDHKRGVAFLSADRFRGDYNTVMGRWNLTAGELGKGDLWYFEVDRHMEPRRLWTDGFDLEKNDFHPLGLGIHDFAGVDDKAERFLYAINHRRAGSTIELFSLAFTVDDLNDTVPSIAHIRTISHPVLSTPNSILPLPERPNGRLEFYVTNDHYFHNTTIPRLKFWENALRLPLASVAFCSVDPNPVKTPPEAVTCRLVARGLRFANGLASSPDHTILHVAETLGFQISSYTIQPSHDLAFLGSTPVGYAIDNLESTPDGTVYAAGHPDPKLVPWVAAGVPDPNEPDAYRAEKRPGGRIVRVKPVKGKEAKEWDVATVYEGVLGELDWLVDGVLIRGPVRPHADDGNYFGTTSTGAMDKERGIFLASGLYDIGLLVCRKRPE